MIKKPYDLIERVIKAAGRPLCAHEFASVKMERLLPDTTDSRVESVDGREFVGQSEASIARRLREMRGLGRVSGKRREGKSFVEYDLVSVAAVAA